MGAAANGDVPEIERLLRSGVNVNCRSHSTDGTTPLIWAVWERQAAAVEVLLAAGSDPNIANGTGKTPLSLAIGGPQEDTSRIVKDLVLAGAKTEECKPLFESLPQDDPKRIAFEHALKERAVKEGNKRKL